MHLCLWCQVWAAAAEVNASVEAYSPETCAEENAKIAVIIHLNGVSKEEGEMSDRDYIPTTSKSCGL